MAAVPVLTFTTHLTAVAATSTSDYTVVFLGTNKGHLKKVSEKYNLTTLITEFHPRSGGVIISGWKLNAKP